jgi:hypothetical protein
MIFNKTGRLLLRRFILNGVRLEVVRSYKYLGFVITPSGELGTGMKDLRDRAFRAFMKIKADLGSSFSKDVPLLVRSIGVTNVQIRTKASKFDQRYFLLCRMILEG